jgi:hypothetical protein
MEIAPEAIARCGLLFFMAVAAASTAFADLGAADCTATAVASPAMSDEIPQTVRADAAGTGSGPAEETSGDGDVSSRQSASPTMFLTSLVVAVAIGLLVVGRRQAGSLETLPLPPPLRESPRGVRLPGASPTTGAARRPVRREETRLDPTTNIAEEV